MRKGFGVTGSGNVYLRMASAFLVVVSYSTTSGVVLAEAVDEECFDKGSLSYVDCGSAGAPAFYIGGRGGAVWVGAESEFSDSGDTLTFEWGDTDLGYAVSGALGYEFVDVEPGLSLRPELEVGYLSADYDEVSIVIPGFAATGVVDGHTSVLFGFANLFADFEVASNIDLILGGGVGFGEVEIELPQDTFDDTTFGYNIGAGFGVDVADGVAIETMYRYMSFSEAELEFAAPDVEEGTDIEAHTATVGVRVDF